MPVVLTANATIVCGPPAPPIPALPGTHGGKVGVAFSGDAKLTVVGARVLVGNDVAGRSVAGCQLAAVQGNLSCTLVALPPPGLGNPLDPSAFAKKLTVGGQPVLLATLGGSTNGAINGAPQRALLAVETQVKLTSA